MLGRPGKAGRAGTDLHDGLFIGTVHLHFLKHLQEVLGLHPNSVGKSTPTPQ